VDLKDWAAFVSAHLGVILQNGIGNNMNKHDEISIAHMSMIQGIVTRLETNSFTLKALSMTLATVVLAFSGSVKNPNWEKYGIITNNAGKA